eukprot:TRINITY_DN8123_c0_g1_i1.p1 TRINITY_DN8123_c0_g1~~TRINITY_DN8123_c0_g1_i1.p1  ORF type:complete len:324 (-),score=139.61 TRINITY_DN8123_c0_g1_i1:124-1095(-)
MFKILKNKKSIITKNYSINFNNNLKLKQFINSQNNKKTFNLRRALFYVPGNDERKIQKAKKLDLDCVCLDIEDGVAENRKALAREIINETLKKEAHCFGRAEKAIRINSLNSNFFEQDLISLIPILNQIDSIVLPKVENDSQISFISNWLDQQNHPNISLIAQIESAKGLVNLKEICTASTKLQALIYSSEDLCADMGMTRTREAKELLYSRSRLVTYSIAFKLQPIDMVHINFRNLDELKEESIEAAQMGFTGKQAIHPDQIPIIYEAFRPPQHIIEFAQRIIEASKQKLEEGSGAFSVDGVMVDAPLIKWAARILSKSNIN